MGNEPSKPPTLAQQVADRVRREEKLSLRERRARYRCRGDFLTEERLLEGFWGREQEEEEQGAENEEGSVSDEVLGDAAGGAKEEAKRERKRDKILVAGSTFGDKIARFMGIASQDEQREKSNGGMMFRPRPRNELHQTNCVLALKRTEQRIRARARAVEKERRRIKLRLREAVENLNQQLDEAQEADRKQKKKQKEHPDEEVDEEKEAAKYRHVDVEETLRTFDGAIEKKVASELERVRAWPVTFDPEWKRTAQDAVDREADRLALLELARKKQQAAQAKREAQAAEEAEAKTRSKKSGKAAGDGAEGKALSKLSGKAAAEGTDNKAKSTKSSGKAAAGGTDAKAKSTKSSDKQIFVPEDTDNRANSNKSSDKQKSAPEDTDDKAKSSKSSDKQKSVPEDPDDKAKSTKSSDKQKSVPEDTDDEAKSSKLSDKQKSVPEDADDKAKSSKSSDKQKLMPEDTEDKAKSTKSLDEIESDNIGDEAKSTPSKTADDTGSEAKSKPHSAISDGDETKNVQSSGKEAVASVDDEAKSTKSSDKAAMESPAADEPRPQQGAVHRYDPRGYMFGGGFRDVDLATRARDRFDQKIQQWGREIVALLVEAAREDDVVCQPPEAKDNPNIGAVFEPRSSQYKKKSTHDGKKSKDDGQQGNDAVPKFKFSDLHMQQRNDAPCEKPVNFKHNKLMNDRIVLCRTDITTLEVDAIVNAANSSLMGGGGIDGAIHRAAGPKLQDECQLLHGAPTGQTKTTRGYNLPAKLILHTVGPVGERPGKLHECYVTIGEQAREHNVHTLALCGVSSGIFGYPLFATAHVALFTIRSWLEQLKAEKKLKDFKGIIFCTFLEKELACYEQLIPLYFPPEGETTSSMLEKYQMWASSWAPNKSTSKGKKKKSKSKGDSKSNGKDEGEGDPELDSLDAELQAEEQERREKDAKRARLEAGRDAQFAKYGGNPGAGYGHTARAETSAENQAATDGTTPKSKKEEPGQSKTVVTASPDPVAEKKGKKTVADKPPGATFEASSDVTGKVDGATPKSNKDETGQSKTIATASKESVAEKRGQVADKPSGATLQASSETAGKVDKPKENAVKRFTEPSGEPLDEASSSSELDGSEEDNISDRSSTEADSASSGEASVSEQDPGRSASA